MAYQLSDLITEVQHKAKDTSFSSALITYYLNDIQREVLGEKRWPFLEALEEHTLTTGDQSYTYTADIQTVYDVTMVNPDESRDFFQLCFLPHTDFYEKYEHPETDTQSRPLEWTDFAGVIYFDRPVDDDYELRIRYLSKPGTLSADADVPDIPEAYKEILVRGALASIEEYRDNWDIGALHRRKVEDLVANMSSRLMPRQFQRAPKARPLRGTRRAAF